MTRRRSVGLLAAAALGFGWLGGETIGHAAEPADIEARLRALEDRVAIEQLLMRYAAALNTEVPPGSKPPTIHAMGRYEDQLVKQGGQWFFSKRVVVTDMNETWSP